MRLFIFLCTLCFVPSVFAAELPDYDIKAYCKQVSEFSGGSNVIEVGCRDMEKKSKAALSQLEVPQKTLQYCDQVASTSGGSYALLEGCIQMEMEAAQELQ